MKIKSGFIMRKINDVNVVVPVGAAAEGFSAMITLNGSGAFLWGLLEKDVTEEQLLSAMLERYDIDEATARRDIDVFLTKARNEGILEE